MKGNNMGQMNLERASWAAVGLGAFAARVGQAYDLRQESEPGDVGVVMSDLIADLLHLAEVRKINVDEILNTAKQYFDYEKEHDE